MGIDKLSQQQADFFGLFVRGIVSCLRNDGEAGAEMCVFIVSASASVARASSSPAMIWVGTLISFRVGTESARSAIPC